MARSPTTRRSIRSWPCSASTSRPTPWTAAASAPPPMSPLHDRGRLRRRRRRGGCCRGAHRWTDRPVWPLLRGQLRDGRRRLHRQRQPPVVYEPSLGLTYPPGSIERIEAALVDGDHDAAIMAVLVDILEMTVDEIDTLRRPAVARAARGGPHRSRVSAGSSRTGCASPDSSTPSPRRHCCSPDRTASPTSSTPPRAGRGRDPRARVQVLDGHGHFAHKTDPAVVTEIIRNFVAS